MFVGETGLGRVIKRACEVMNELGTNDPEAVRKAGAIDLPTVQRYLNFWFSSSLDLFGSDVSTNAASYFANGLKGRPDESQYEDHVAAEGTYTIEQIDEKTGKVFAEDVPLRNAMNAVARHGYIKDCEIGVKRWNRTIKKQGIDFELTLPSERFRRNIGLWAGFHFDPEGNPVSAEAFERRLGDWIPGDSDRGHVKSLMKQVIEPGKMASWIAPPDRGINNQPVDYEYVRL